ncbi:epidermal retinol dehydrogenase 2 [Aphelenchoides avenae]|nr:epidermal retinol dehydrogenase 2 [Aphelenchus avenae]
MQFLVDIILWILTSIAKLYELLVPSSKPLKKSLSGQVVLVTGGGGGIGRELALRFAENGCILALWDIATRPNEETAELCRDMGVMAKAYTVDICDRHAVYETARLVERDLGPVDILVNNAGLINFKPFLESDDEKLSKLLDVNAKSLFWTTKAFLPRMIEQGRGHLVCICSVAGLIGSPVLVDYTASKHAAFGFMEALQHQMLDQGHNYIKFTTACPIYVNTPMLTQYENAKKLQPWLEPDYVADEIISAIRTEKRVLILPNTAALVYGLKGILPWDTYTNIILSRHRNNEKEAESKVR